MVGIIQTQINKQDPFSDIKGYEAERVAEAPEDTVESRVQGIIDRGGPAQQSEVTRSQQAANRKGVLNTSMAIGAGERARYDYALPIASQDSSQSLQRRMADSAAVNRGFEYTAGQSNIAGQQERAGQQQLDTVAATGRETRESDVARAGLTRTENQAQAEEAARVATTGNERQVEAQAIADEEARFVAEQQRAQDVIMENLDATNAETLTNIQGAFNERIQTSTSSANIFNSYSNNVSQILSNPDIEVSQKQQLVAKELEMMQAALGVQAAIFDVDLSVLSPEPVANPYGNIGLNWPGFGGSFR